jgi:hypothetical protein
MQPALQVQIPLDPAPQADALLGGLLLRGLWHDLLKENPAVQAHGGRARVRQAFLVRPLRQGLHETGHDGPALVQAQARALREGILLPLLWTGLCHGPGIQAPPCGLHRCCIRDTLIIFN